MIPLEKESVMKMKNVCVIPIGTVHQLTIGARVTAKKKEG